MASNAVSATPAETVRSAKSGSAPWWLVAPALNLFVIINQLDRFGPRQSAIWGFAEGCMWPVCNSYAGGWRTVFWACSVGSVLILLPMFLWLVPAQPAQSRFVKDDERLFIESHHAMLPKAATPVKFAHVLKDRRFWLVTAVLIGNPWKGAARA